MSNKVTELKTTVCNETKVFLEETGKSLGISAGEIIDRLVLKCCPQDAQDASLLMLDYIFLSCARLDHETFNDAIYSVLKVLENSFAEDVPDETKSTMKSILDRLNEDGETIDD